MKQENILPPLRQDLDLSPTGRDRDNVLRYVIYDPVAHRYFELSARAVTLLSNWTLGTLDRLQSTLVKKGEEPPSEQEIEALVTFLRKNLLLQTTPSEPLANIQRNRGPLKRAQMEVIRLLFFKLPILRPEPLLATLSVWTAPLFTRTFAILSMIAALIGFTLIAQRPEVITQEFRGLANPGAAIAVIIALVILKTIHELGHGLFAYRAQVRVPRMGVMLIVGLPLPYTELTDTWRVASRRQRLFIDMGGVLAELSVAAWATLLFAFMPEGAPRSAVFYIATLSWMTSILINLNPLMKFDGYYILSDLMRLTNLNERSFTMGRWRLRELLFDLRDPVPEAFSPGLERGLITLAFATWIYRIFLYLGIGAIIYTFAPRVIGAALFAFVLIMFLGRPIAKEIASYWEDRGRIMRRLRIYVWVLVLIGAVVALTLPRSQTLSLPARIAPQSVLTIAMPVTGTLAILPPDSVEAGDAVFQVAEPELPFLIKQSEARLALLRTQLERRATTRDQLDQSSILQEQLAQEQALRAELAERAEALTLRAPVAAQFVTDRAALPGQSAMLATATQLGQYISPEQWSMSAYLSGADLRHASVLGEGIFYPRDPTLPTFTITITEISPTFAGEITYPEFSQLAGGPIATQGRTLQPVASWLAIQGALNDAPPDQPMAIVGTLKIAGLKQSIANRIGIQIRRVLIREGGL